MRSLIELETFISIGETADRLAKVGITDFESDSYKTAFVSHFKSLVRVKPYDFTAKFLNEFYEDIAGEGDDSLYFQYGYLKQFLKSLPTELENALAISDSNHGGVRQGAGRKKSAPTKQVRVPEDLVHVVAALVEAYKSGRWDSEYRTRVSRYINETDMATLVDDAKIERDWLIVKNRNRNRE